MYANYACIHKTISTARGPLKIAKNLWTDGVLKANALPRSQPTVSKH